MTNFNFINTRQYLKLSPQKSFFVQKLLNKKKNSITNNQLQKIGSLYSKIKLNKIKRIGNQDSVDSLTSIIKNRYFKIKLFGYKRLVKAFLIKKGKSKKFQSFTYRSHMFLNKRYPQFRLKTHIEIFFNRYAFPKIAIEKYPIYRKRKSKKPYHTYKLLGTHIEQKYIFNFFKDHLRQKLQRNLETKFEAIFLTLASKKIDLNSVQRKKNKNMVEKWYRFHQGRFRYLEKEKKIKRQEFLLQYKEKFQDPEKLSKLIERRYIRRIKMNRKQLKRFRELRKLERKRRSYPSLIVKVERFSAPWKIRQDSALLLPKFREFLIKNTHFAWAEGHKQNMEAFLHQFKSKKRKLNINKKISWWSLCYNRYLESRNALLSQTFKYKTEGYYSKIILKEIGSQHKYLRKQEAAFWKVWDRKPGIIFNFIKVRTLLFHSRKGKEALRFSLWGAKYGWNQTELEKSIFKQKRLKSLNKRIRIHHEKHYVTPTNFQKKSLIVTPTSIPSTFILSMSLDPRSWVSNLFFDKKFYKYIKNLRRIYPVLGFEETLKFYDISKPREAFIVAFNTLRPSKLFSKIKFKYLLDIFRENEVDAPNFHLFMSKLALSNVLFYTYSIPNIYKGLVLVNSHGKKKITVTYRSHNKFNKFFYKLTRLRYKIDRSYYKYHLKNLFNDLKIWKGYKKTLNTFFKKVSKAPKLKVIGSSIFQTKLSKNSKNIIHFNQELKKDPFDLWGMNHINYFNKWVLENKKSLLLDKDPKKDIRNIYTKDRALWKGKHVSAYLKDPSFILLARNFNMFIFRRWKSPSYRNIWRSYMSGLYYNRRLCRIYGKLIHKKALKREIQYEQTIESSLFILTEPYKYLNYFTGSFDRNHLDTTSWNLLEKQFFAESLKINKKLPLGKERKYRFQKISETVGSHFIMSLTINKPFWNLTNFESIKKKPRITNFSSGKFSHTGFVRSNIFFNDFIYNIPLSLKTTLPTYRKFPIVFKKNNFILNFQIKSWTKESLQMFDKTFQSRLSFGINKLNIKIKSLPIQKKTTRRTVLTSPHVNKNAQQHLDQIKYSKIYLLECFETSDSSQIFSLIWKLIFLDLKANSLELKFISSIKRNK